MAGADFVFNIAKGRVGEYHQRVENDDPANSALIVVALAATGLEADAVLIDKDTLAAVVSGTTNEATNTNYARQVLTQAELSAYAVDDGNDRAGAPFPAVTFANVEAGDDIAKLLVCYDPDTTGGDDTSIIPLTAHNVTITPDGNDIDVTAAATDYFRAQEPA